MKKNKGKRRLPGQFYTITFKIISYVLILMVAMIVIALSVMTILYYCGVFGDSGHETANPIVIILIVILVSAVLVGVLAVGLYSYSFKGLNQFQAAMNKVAKGDFSVTLPTEEDNYMYALNSSFNAMVASLKSIETLKTDFISNFSHEFKTPISSICGFAKLLKNPRISDEEKQEYIDIIISESDRLTLLSKNTLSLSKLDNQETIYEKKNYSLDEQLRKCALMFQTQVDRKNIELSLFGEADYCGNEELMQQLWINLVGNAVKFTPENGSVDISVEKRDGGIAVSVRDTGIGMDEETKSRIFERFYQGDSSRSVSGNGLGLAIVKRILQIVGGNITVESEPSKGSTFTVFLPDEAAELKDTEKKKTRKSVSAHR